MALLELVEDGGVVRGVRVGREVREDVGRLAEARRRVEVHPVRPRRPGHRAVVVVGDRERAGELVVGRDVGLVVPAHRARAGVERRGPGRRRPVGSFQPLFIVTKPSILPLSISWCVPAHSWSVSAVQGCGAWIQGTAAPSTSGFVGAGVGALDVGPVRELVQVPEVAVEGVVLHHHDDDVLDGHRRRAAWWGPASPRACRPAPYMQAARPAVAVLSSAAA